MAHPGFGFQRRSFHTLKALSCPRKAYFAQMLEIRRRSQNGQESGALAAGKVFHTLMEVHYTPDRYKGTPLPGTDGNPSLTTADEVRDWYLSRNFDTEAVCEAMDAYARYLIDRGRDPEIADRIVFRPEPNVEGDLRDLFPPFTRKLMSQPIPYAAQFDAVIRNPANGPKGVISVEHKLLSGFYPNTLKSYLASGQLVGQCAVWNSRADLVEKFGPMEQVMLNLAFKRPSKTNPIYTHRTVLFIPRDWQLNYVKAVRAETARLEQMLADDAHDQRQPTPMGAALWPQSGLVHGECVQMTYNCEFLEACQDNAVEPELYQITEAGKARAAREKAVQVSRHLEVYEP